MVRKVIYSIFFSAANDLIFRIEIDQIHLVTGIVYSKSQVTWSVNQKIVWINSQSIWCFVFVLKREMVYPSTQHHSNNIR